MMRSRPSRLNLTTSLAGMVAVLAFTAVTVAQTLPPGYQRSLSLARAAMQEAIAANVEPYPDQPLWAKAIRLAESVVEMAPLEAGGLGLRAEVYSRSNFFGRAWPGWEAYLDAGHALTPEQTPIFLEVGEQLAWSAYERGDRERAAELHLAMLDAVPFSKESRVWVARIRMEQGRPVDAIPYWEAVVAQDPEDERAKYFLALARDQARWGVTAADAFREGVAHYEAGEMDAARRALERASEANPEYAEAWAWRGRIAFEAASYLVALRHYERAAELAPNVDAYRYFLSESQRLLDEETSAAAETEEPGEGETP